MSWLVRLILGLGLLVWLLSTVRLPEVVAAIASAAPFLVGLAVVLSLAQVWISAARLKLLLDWRGLKASLAFITHVTFVANLYGLLLPGEAAATAVRWHRLTRLAGRGADVLAALVLTRLAFLVMLIAMGAACAGLGAGDVALQRVAFWVLSALLAGLIGMTLLVVHSKLAARVGAWSPPASFWAWPWRALGKLAVAVRSYRDLPPKRLAAVLGLALVENLIGLATFVLLAMALHLDVAALVLGWVRSLIQIATMLPVSVAGIGVRDGGLIVLLEPYGVASGEALALSFLLLSRILLLAMVGAVLEAAGAAWPRKREPARPERAGHPAVALSDFATAAALLALLPVAWLVPERWWSALCLRGAWVMSWVGSAGRRRRLQVMDQARSGAPDLPPAAVIDQYLAAGRLERMLQELKELRPGGWRPRIEPQGAAQIREALARGSGAILWVAPFRSSTLIVKKGLYEGGFRVSQLSRPYHGPSQTEFGRRVLNRVRMGVEERYLSERVLMPEGSERQALDTLRQRLQAGGLVTITCTPDGRRLIEQPLLAGRLPLAGGAPSLALSTGAPLLPVIALQEGPGRFCLVVDPPLDVPSSAERGAAIVDLTRQYAVRIEAHMRRHPLLCEAWLDMSTPLTAGFQAPMAAVQSTGGAREAGGTLRGLIRWMSSP
jgi:uncharacterized membrane protein YbhN (UPF0104 family)/lauroyl/myristoyl acyltransferase